MGESARAPATTRSAQSRGIFAPAALGAVEDAGVNAVQVVADFTIEVEGAAKPACVAQAIYRYYA